MPSFDLLGESEPRESDEAASRSGHTPSTQPVLDDPSINPHIPAPSALPLIKDHPYNPSEILNEACYSGNLRLVQSVLARLPEEDPDAQDAVANKLNFHMACAALEGHADIVSFLLDHGADVGGSAAPFAARQKDADAAIRVFEVLFNHGLDLKCYPGLLHGVTENQPLLEYLLSKGADPNGLDDFESLPHKHCVNCASIGILIDYGADIRSGFLHEAATVIDEEECMKRMEYVLERGVDIDAPAVYLGIGEPGTRWYRDGMRQTGNEGTALHWTVRGFRFRGYDVNPLPRVKWLLEKGANRDIRDNNGHKPIDYASDQVMIDLLSN